MYVNGSGQCEVAAGTCQLHTVNITQLYQQNQAEHNKNIAEWYIISLNRSDTPKKSSLIIDFVTKHNRNIEVNWHGMEAKQKV